LVAEAAVAVPTVLQAVLVAVAVPVVA